MNILGIETSCDETSASVVRDGHVISNIISSQLVHRDYGGVVPELASREHERLIVSVVSAALDEANIQKNDLDIISATAGPGLIGAVMVGLCFAQGMAYSLGIPLIPVNHIEAHIFSAFLDDKKGAAKPPESFISLTVSGGHTLLCAVHPDLTYEVIGRTIDDAAGEAFDKAARIMGLPYPGGPLIDKLAREGDARAFDLSKPKIPGYDYSFSGLKTSFLYLVRDELKKDAGFIEKQKANLAASMQRVIVEVLLDKLIRAALDSGIREIALAGGVAANSGLREALVKEGNARGWKVHIPKMEYTTDNAAMIAVAGYFKYLNREFASQKVVPYTRGII